MKEKLLGLRQNQMVLSGLYKAISGLALFVSIPLLIRYLGNVEYGLWILVSTLFQWVLLMDFGLASVLKTKIPELKILGNISLLNAYIKSTYKISCYIALIIFISFAIIFLLFDIKSLLNIDFDRGFVTKLFMLNIFFFCSNFVLNTHKSLFVSVHRGKFAEQSLAVNQIIILICLILLLYYFPRLDIESKFYIVSIVNGGICILINLIYTRYFFRTEKFSMKTIEKLPKDYLNGIYKLGFRYMAMQMGIMCLFSSDNYILAYFFSPAEIVPYEIVSKYFQFPLMILIAGLAPLWSMFTKNYFEQNTSWLLLSFKRFNYFYILVVIGIFSCVLLAQPVMKIWISKDFQAPKCLLIAIGIMTALRIFTTFYSYFFFGIGKLQSYLLLLGTSVLLKIPLTILFIKMNFGISSVVIASGTCLLAWSIIQPLQAYRIVSKLKSTIRNNDTNN